MVQPMFHVEHRLEVPGDNSNPPATADTQPTGGRVIPDVDCHG